MKNQAQTTTTRRDFVKASGAIAATTALAGAVIPHVHAAEDNTVQVALVGCGGRGTGAAGDCAERPRTARSSWSPWPTSSRTASTTAIKALSDDEFEQQVDVPDDRKFIGFDAYKKAMDCLKPGDVAIFATPLAFRWVHFKYAIEKGVNVFMEKPVTVDGASTGGCWRWAKRRRRRT